MPGSKQGEQNLGLYLQLQPLETKVGFSAAHFLLVLRVLITHKGLQKTAYLAPWLGGTEQGNTH